MKSLSNQVICGVESASNFIEPISLVVTIDTSGVAHIINPHTNGEELISVDLLPFHNGSPILVSDVEGESEDGPILVTGSADGDLHVLGIQVVLGCC